MSKTSRNARVIQTIRDHLAEMITRHVKDPRVHAVPLLTIQNVDLNRDMSVATIYVSFGGADPTAVDSALAGLEAASTFLRGPLARRMNLARAPALRFVEDTSIAFSIRLQQIVQEDERQTQQEESPPDPCEPPTERG